MRTYVRRTKNTNNMRSALRHYLLKLSQLKQKTSVTFCVFSFLSSCYTVALRSEFVWYMFAVVPLARAACVCVLALLFFSTKNTMFGCMWLHISCHIFLVHLPLFPVFTAIEFVLYLAASFRSVRFASPNLVLCRQKSSCDLVMWTKFFVELLPFGECVCSPCSFFAS